MPPKPCRQHGIQLFVFPFGVALLLAASHVLFHLNYAFPSRPLQARSELTTTTSATINSIAIPFGSTDYSANFSTPVIHSPLFKRAPPRTFEDARCRGEAFWTRIREIYRNPLQPGPQYSYSDLSAAWEHSIPDEQDKDSPDGFIPFFEQVVQGAISYGRVNHTVMAQKSRYRDRLGRQQPPSRPFTFPTTVTQKPEAPLTSKSPAPQPPTTPSTSAPPPPSSPSTSPAPSTNSTASENPSQKPTPSALTSTAGPTCSGTSGPTSSPATTPPPAPPTKSPKTNATGPKTPRVSATSATT
ncbi:MAG: hypothetical protein Q9183_005578 [Haloplaca sp. 2 TL-2023]